MISTRPGVPYTGQHAPSGRNEWRPFEEGEYRGRKRADQVVPIVGGRSRAQENQGNGWESVSIVLPGHQEPQPAPFILHAL